ncbi:RHS repeat-associated core domain-containing protein, partial [Cellulomonas sp. APG4]|uniref:RHS repeat-associated core domain-containing protein n=1 Tax=Cellulomonas sp. APG4 TaxID=1538656 RepID=UPI00192A4421
SAVGARYYDPTLGRFISVDPVMDLTDPAQWHGYSYANNNPITNSDPTGLLPGAPMIDGQHGSTVATNGYQRQRQREKAKGGGGTGPASAVTKIVSKPTATTYDDLASLYNAGDYDGFRAAWTPKVERMLANDPNRTVAWSMYSDVLEHERVCAEQACAPPCRDLACTLMGMASILSGFIVGPILSRLFSVALLRFAARAPATTAASTTTAANTGTALVKYDADFAVGQLTAGGRATASQLDEFGAAQGWARSQTATGPVKYTDGNGVVRLTIKQGSPRAPGSGGPHVELRNADGARIDPFGNPVSRTSPGNHTPIVWDW